jgi:hypothetical protein
MNLIAFLCKTIPCSADQHGLSAVEQCFSLTANQPQPAYKKKKTVCRTKPMFKTSILCVIDVSYLNWRVFVLQY